MGCTLKFSCKFIFSWRGDGNPLVQRPAALDELALARLRRAISNDSEGVSNKEQLDGVLRMLGAAEISEENQLALFGRKPPPRA
jgi:hypothetical protein